jgi:hypothetical protein
LTQSGSVYTWGINESGQLGTGDLYKRSTPCRVDALLGKKVTSVACGKNFVIALGLTLTQKYLELENRSRAKKGHIRKPRSNSKNKKSNSKKGEYDTIHSHHHIGVGSGKESSKKSKSAAKTNTGQNHSIIKSSDHGKNYTPLRSSPERAASKITPRGYLQEPHNMSNSRSRRKNSKNILESLDYKSPSQIHEQVVNSLRREKDSL